MIIQVDLSLYPLKTSETGEIIESFLHHVSMYSVSLEPGPMSSIIRGEVCEVFKAIHASFMQVANEEEVVLVIKVSNACPDKASVL